VKGRIKRAEGKAEEEARQRVESKNRTEGKAEQGQGIREQMREQRRLPPCMASPSSCSIFGAPTNLEASGDKR
jgi:hypothetical protein